MIVHVERYKQFQVCIIPLKEKMCMKLIFHHIELSNYGVTSEGKHCPLS